MSVKFICFSSCSAEAEVNTAIVQTSLSAHSQERALCMQQQRKQVSKNTLLIHIITSQSAVFEWGVGEDETYRLIGGQNCFKVS